MCGILPQRRNRNNFHKRCYNIEYGVYTIFINVSVRGDSGSIPDAATEFLQGLRLLLLVNINFFNIAVIHKLLASRINSFIALFILSLLVTILFFSQPL